ncbi:MAG: hypothetical protein GY754_14560 [bacterium]|nr:hypothetical protein [bacterium]
MDDKLTIVGPEPSGDGSRKKQKSFNIEALMLMAKYDAGFREKLFSNRDSAISESGIDFSAGEKLLLKNISVEQLEKNITEFRIPGVTRKSLPSWRTAASILVLLSSMFFSYSSSDPALSASTLGGVAPDIDFQAQKTLGWINADTYRGVGKATPAPNAQGKSERRMSSKEAALLDAQYRIIEKFIGSRLTATGNLHSNKTSKKEKFFKIVKAGKIIKATYDNEDNCEIIYEIEAKGLRKMVEQGL